MLRFKQTIEEKKLTKAELKKREEVAKAIERDDPDMPMDKKMAIATSTAKRVAEARMVKTRGRFDPIVKADVQKMSKHPKYKGDNSGFERAVREKHGKHADHFVIQNIIRKHAEMESVSYESVKVKHPNLPKPHGDIDPDTLPMLPRKLRGKKYGTATGEDGKKYKLLIPRNTTSRTVTHVGSDGETHYRNPDYGKKNVYQGRGVKESVNEVSAKTLSNYIKGSSKDLGNTDYVRGLTKGQEMMGLKRPENPDDKRKSQNRSVGIIRAADKLRRKIEKKSLNQSTNENVHDLRYDANTHFDYKDPINVQRKTGDDYHVHLKSYNTKDDVHKFLKDTGNDKTYALTHFGKTMNGTRATLTKKTNNESIVKKGINSIATNIAGKTKDPNLLRRWAHKAANKVVDLTQEGMTKSVNDARGVYAQLRRKRRREVNDDYSPQKLEWGTEASTEWAKNMTPGEGKGIKFKSFLSKVKGKK